jgi:hypothetical protein
VNGVGRNVRNEFGYGIMDDYEMVKMDRNWKNVKEKNKCEVYEKKEEKIIKEKSNVNIKMNVKECDGVKVIENVKDKVSIE